MLDGDSFFVETAKARQGMMIFCNPFDSFTTFCKNAVYVDEGPLNNDHKEVQYEKKQTREHAI